MAMLSFDRKTGHVMKQEAEEFFRENHRMREERDTVLLMINLYCRHKEGNPQLCADCRALADYAVLRLSRCRFAADKPTCRQCPVHCYRPDMKAQMRAVMRYAGPLMLLYHPWIAVKHLLREWCGR